MRDSRCEYVRNVGWGAAHPIRPRPMLWVLVAVVWSLAGACGQVTAANADQNAGPARSLAAIQSGPQLCPDGLALRRLMADAADGIWNEHSLLEAALIAAGCDQRHRGETIRRWTALCDEFAVANQFSAARDTVQVDQPASERCRAARALALLHRRVLTGRYGKPFTDPATTIGQGNFNCVSATILFHCLARRCGLQVVAVESPAHVHSRILAGGASFDVQTTAPDGLSPGRAGAGRQGSSFGVRLPVATDTPPRVLSDVQLVAMVFYNRGVEMLRREQFPAAVAANEISRRLDPQSETARGNLLAALNNWSVTLCRAGQFERSLQMLLRGLAIDPRHESLLENDLYLHGRWVEHACRLGQYKRALEVLDRARRRRPDEARFVQWQSDVYRRWGESLLDAVRPDEAVTVFHRAAEVVSPQHELRPLGGPRAVVLQQVESHRQRRKRRVAQRYKPRVRAADGQRHQPQRSDGPRANHQVNQHEQKSLFAPRTERWVRGVK